MYPHYLVDRKRRRSSCVIPFIKRYKATPQVPRMVCRKSTVVRKRVVKVPSPFGHVVRTTSNPPSKQNDQPMFRTIRIRATTSPLVVTSNSLLVQDAANYGITTGVRYQTLTPISIRAYNQGGGFVTITGAVSIGDFFVQDEGTPGGMCSSVGYMLPLAARTTPLANNTTQLFSVAADLVVGAAAQLVVDVYCRLS